MSPDIVRQIWNAKSRRQLIFASHNANFVVNGDAELVVCCDYIRAGDQTGGQIKAVGRSEEHTSELQSRRDIVCRLLLEKKNDSLSRLVLASMLGGSEFSCHPNVLTSFARSPKCVARGLGSRYGRVVLTRIRPDTFSGGL